MRSMRYLGGAVALVAVLVLGLAVYIGSQPPPRAAALVLPRQSNTRPSIAPSSAPTVPESILATLTRQGKALVDGDHDGYLAPAGGGLRDGFERRYGSLRALGVQAWKPSFVDRPAQEPDGTWSVVVRFDYCFGKGCTRLFAQTVQTAWTVTGTTATIARYEQTSEPWDASALTVVTGRRVIVAGSAANAGRLQKILDQADPAADIADRYARWDPAPTWYIVYVAGEGEWKSWWDNSTYGGTFYDGYSTGPRGIVMHAADAGQPWLRSLLTHEFGHVVTIGEYYGGGDFWWLTEGIADYISDRDGATTRDRLPGVRRYVKNSWDGRLVMGPPPEKATNDEINARYGIALLTVTCLSQRYGEEKMISFFESVVRRKQPIDLSATVAFGTAWPAVESACAARIRSA